jgi:preprotein translocase subunit SecD
MVAKLILPLTALFVFSLDNTSIYLTSSTACDDSLLKTGWYFISDTPNSYQRQLDKDSKTYFINPRPLITANNIVSIELYKSADSSYALSMKLDEIGSRIWQKATEETVGRNIAFIVNNTLVYTPKVNSPIYNGIAPLNRGIYSKQELELIKLHIERGKK